MRRIEIRTEITGTVWKILLPVGHLVATDDTIILVESMKMEIPVLSTQEGTLVEVLVDEGEIVESGQVVAVIAV